ncbi:phytanoyl-CoA dioxygenase family protein [Burkholderia ubonensis]|uniref:phytanoyl-CoA dioxygenase family protein n=1 Tax=Burkholderia ubonensis TaxID=101571 RepID=UPI002ABE8C1C|nr:phytanoyl-CoA dioxygenase family protein [Burkholderia ubonensis]
MNTRHDQFREHGFVVLAQEIAGPDRAALEQEYARLATEAENELLRRAQGRAGSGSALIAVAEADDPRQLCRFEYLAGSSVHIRQVLVPRLAALIARMIGEPVLLFKDKCNLKRPGGGAFRPHQDVTAYRHFKTRYQVTAAIALDGADRTNGALEMAETWNATPPGIPAVVTPRGELAILPSYDGGRRNGDIADEYAAAIGWRLIDAQPGDVILFDSYVPHRSGVNRSGATRRVLFFTFNPASEGDLYEIYYGEKRCKPTNPIFHVSTPTVHSGLNAPAE